MPVHCRVVCWVESKRIGLLETDRHGCLLDQKIEDIHGQLIIFGRHKNIEERTSPKHIRHLGVLVVKDFDELKIPEVARYV